MTIQIEWHWNVKPGRFDDFIAGIRRIEEAAQNDGLPEPLRTAVWQAGLGGTTAGAAVHVVERESLAALAEVEARSRPAVSAAYAKMTGPEGSRNARWPLGLDLDWRDWRDRRRDFLGAYRPTATRKRSGLDRSARPHFGAGTGGRREWSAADAL